MNTLFTTVAENAIFVVEFLGIIAAMILVSWGVERAAARKNAAQRAENSAAAQKTAQSGKTLTTRKIAAIGVFSAIATILHILDFPIFFAPGFYKLDFSELPVLIGGFAFGPVAAALIEFCKIILKILFKGTSTAFVGDLANFLVGCTFVLPASMIYLLRKTRKNAIRGCAIGTLIMTVFGTAFNAVYLLPKFAQLYGMPLEAIIEMGHAVNPAINSVATLVIFAVAPMNLLKGGVVSLLTLLVYKKISPILHNR